MDKNLERRFDDEFSACPKWDKHELTNEQIEEIAERAAQKAVRIARDNFYKDVGRAAISKWLIAIGIFTVGFYAFLRNKGVL